MLFSRVAKLFQCAYSKWFRNKNSDMMSKLDKKAEKFGRKEGKVGLKVALLEENKGNNTGG